MRTEIARNVAVVSCLLLAADMTAQERDAAARTSLPVNRWVKLPAKRKEAGYVHSQPIYVPTRSRAAVLYTGGAHEFLATAARTLGMQV